MGERVSEMSVNEYIQSHKKFNSLENLGVSFFADIFVSLIEKITQFIKEKSK